MKTSGQLNRWRPLTNASVQQLPPLIRPWMMLCSSMTVRLGAYVGQAVHVNLLHEDRGRLYQDEADLFPSCEDHGYVREVCLQTASRNLLAARTVFISRRLKQNTEMASLNRRPLGELLFRKGYQTTWILREFALIDPSSPLYRLARRDEHRSLRAYWARRTMFILNRELLLVTEIFLPSMLYHLNRYRSAEEPIEMNIHDSTSLSNYDASAHQKQNEAPDMCSFN